MLVALSGIARAGKNTTAELLSKKLGLPVKRATMKTFAKEQGVGVLEFEHTIASDTSGKWDKKLDTWIKENAKECIMDGMLSCYDLPHADIKIFLYATEEERAKRTVKDDGVSEKESIAYIRSRDLVFRDRIKKIYGFDWWDHKYYDLCINTGKYNPEQVVEIILKALGE